MLAAGKMEKVGITLPISLTKQTDTIRGDIPRVFIAKKWYIVGQIQAIYYNGLLLRPITIRWCVTNIMRVAASIELPVS